MVATVLVVVKILSVRCENFLHFSEPFLEISLSLKSRYSVHALLLMKNGSVQYENLVYHLYKFDFNALGEH